MFYAHWILHLLTSSLKHGWSNKCSLASAYHTVGNFQLLANLNHMKLNNNQVSFIYFSLQIICIRLSQTAHLRYELTVVLYVLFGKDGTQRGQLYLSGVYKKKIKENNEKDILSRCFSNFGQLPAIRGTQRLFSVQHLFGEANIA